MPVRVQPAMAMSPDSDTSLARHRWAAVWRSLWGVDAVDVGGPSPTRRWSARPGMMSAEQMAELEAAEGAEFEQMWLEMMIEHQQGAIEMAQSEQAEGHHADAIDLAENIESAQQDKIATMETLLGS